MKKNLIIIFLTVILLLGLIYFVYAVRDSKGDDKNMDNTTFTTLSNGMVATYKKYNRNLSLNDFCQVKIGSTYKEVVSKLGEPNGEVGSGISWPYYQLDDGTCIIINCIDYKNDETAQIFNMSILDQCGRVFELKKKE